MHRHIFLRLQSISPLRHPDLSHPHEHSQFHTIDHKSNLEKQRDNCAQTTSPQLHLQPVRADHAARRDPGRLPGAAVQPALEAVHRSGYRTHLVLILGQLRRFRLHARLEISNFTQKVQKQIAKIHQPHPDPHIGLQIRPHAPHGLPLLPGFIHLDAESGLRRGHFHLRANHTARFEPHLRAHEHSRVQTLHAVEQFFAATHSPYAVFGCYFYEILQGARILPAYRKR